MFQIWKLTILTKIKKIKKIKELCTGVLEYVEHIILPIDAEISQKGRSGWELLKRRDAALHTSRLRYRKRRNRLATIIYSTICFLGL